MIYVLLISHITKFFISNIIRAIGILLIPYLNNSIINVVQANNISNKLY